MCCEGMLHLKEGSGPHSARLPAPQRDPPVNEKKRGPELVITYGPDIITYSEILVPIPGCNPPALINTNSHCHSSGLTLLYSVTLRAGKG